MQELERRCTKLSFFLLQNLALQLGLGQRYQPEGIAITWQQFFAYESDVPLRLSAAPCVSFARLAPRLLKSDFAVRLTCDVIELGKV